MKRLRRFHCKVGVTPAAFLFIAFSAAALDLSAPGLDDAEIPLVTPVTPVSSGPGCAPDNSSWASYVPMLGSLHEHSGYSDGTPGTEPRDYFAAGKTLGLDYVGSSEHSDNAALPMTVNGACLSDQLDDCAVADNNNRADAFRKWDATQEQARAATDAAFTAFRGFEWTSDRFGHINVFFSRHDWNAKTTEGYAVSMESFWSWFTTRPEQGGGGDGLAVFNHPGREDQIESSAPNLDPAYAFNDFAYRPDADLRMVGVETFGKGGDAYDTDNNAPPGGWYAHALDQGWHLGPIGAEDEHGTKWAQPSRAKTVLLARDRSEGALREALFARRFYAIAQHHNDLRLAFTVDGQPMGSRLARADGTRLRLKAEVTAGVFDGRLELVSNGGAVVAHTGGAALSRWIRVAGAGERWYFMRVLDKDGNPIAYSAPIWVRAGGAYPVCGEWLAGDLHVHTTYSHDSWSGPGDDNTGPDEFFTLGHSVESQFRIAAARGLDYLAITDHNDIRSQNPGQGFGAHGVVPIPSYENSLKGHAQMHGATRLYDNNQPLQELADELRDPLDDHGVFQINHPAGESVMFPRDADWGEAKTNGPVVDYTGDVVPDTIEVWNIGWAWQPPAPSGNSIDDAMRYWEGWLDRGEKVSATGGSDNHYLATTSVQGNGQPTTWVFSTERSARGVLDGLRQGRTYITHQPPLLHSPRLLLEADSDGDGIYEAVLGDEVPRAAALRVRVSDGQGALLRVIATGGVLSQGPVPAVTPQFEYRFSAPAGATWLRAELVEPDAAEHRATICDKPLGGATTYCRNRLAVLAMTSALYLKD